MLKAEGSYILPENVPANEFMNLENDKISTSRNWAVWLHQYLEDFKDKQDVLRYVLTSNAPETKDNDFIWKDFQAKNNNELLAIYGNFVNRTIVLTHKYFNGKYRRLPNYKLKTSPCRCIGRLSGANWKTSKIPLPRSFVGIDECARLGINTSPTPNLENLQENPQRVQTVLVYPYRYVLT